MRRSHCVDWRIRIGEIYATGDLAILAGLDYGSSGEVSLVGKPFYQIGEEEWARFHMLSM